MTADSNAAPARRILLAAALLLASLAACRLLFWPQAGQAAWFTLAFTVLGAMACILCLRGATRRSDRRPWLLLAAAMGFAIASNSLVGWSSVLEAPALGVAGLALGPLAWASGVWALLCLVRERMGRLPRAAWLDGMVSALVVEAGIALVVMRPVQEAVERQGADAAIGFLYPVAGVFIVGLVAGAAARAGWRLRGWGLVLAGAIAFALGDSLQAAATASAGYQVGGPPDFAWLAGVWLFAAAVWTPAPPRREPALSRALVPAALGMLALTFLMAAWAQPTRAYIPMGLASVALVLVIARFAVALNENKHMLLRARREALTDALTGLPNRRRLIADLDQGLGRATSGEPATLVLFDLNGFKQYNDTYGHPAGDALLKALGSQLSSALSDRGRAYRMGGDEFCALLTGVGDNATWARAAAALRAEGRGFEVSAAYGVVLLPDEAATPTEALRLADQRMYAHKRRGRMASGEQVTGALIRALLERDPDLRAHVDEVRRLAEGVALRLGLGRPDADRIGLAAVLHDVGKLAVPDNILSKPGPLDEQEWELMRQHTVIGQRILEAAPALNDIGPLVRSSHERLDGTGYPDRLTGEKIPIGSRIIAVCDAYHAMVSSRPYRRQVTRKEALAELERCAGSQFDRPAVSAFRDAIEEGARPAPVYQAERARLSA